MKGWMIDEQDESVLTSEAVLGAVAKCPVRNDKQADRTYFEADDFFTIVLDETPPEGTA